MTILAEFVEAETGIRFHGALGAEGASLVR